MPIYEYECRGCGNKFELIRKVGEKGKPPCPRCGGKKVEKLISPAGFVLKGTGWYKTDYPSESRKKAMESEKKAEEPAGKKDAEGKPETAKTEGKAEPAKAGKPKKED